VLLLAATLVVSACTPAATPPASANVPSPVAALLVRLDGIQAAIDQWRDAPDLAAARRAAEAARNLVVGPAGPFYGDADGDGTIGGSSEIGILPGLHGEAGLADPALGSCLSADVLGGDWTDAAARWATLQVAIDAWRPANNTFPDLPSHPQRLVGWATLTLATDSLETAHEFAGHAALHAQISRAAVLACASTARPAGTGRSEA
jgi:hypothetical protein